MVLTEAQEQDLKARFLRRYRSDTLWAIMRRAYSEPHRHYHNLSHLAALFSHFDRVRHLLHYPDAVEDALWWHDFVYSVGEDRGENERLSAEAMRTNVMRYAATLPADERAARNNLDIAVAFIMATIDHAIPAELLADKLLAADAALFLDIDLSVLAGDTADIRRFEDGVRQEYIQYANRIYTFGRIVVLQGLLKRVRIFLSPTFAPLEGKARENLQMLINELTTLRERSEG